MSIGINYLLNEEFPIILFLFEPPDGSELASTNMLQQGRRINIVTHIKSV